ncbi:MAG: tetratricopeptide (TPR) repeat protein [Crocinitomicaceae bacterium]|jgi:tetratricopeptide (TPR) repeat protein
MKQLLLFAFCAFGFFGFSQKMPGDYFNEGYEFYKNENFDEAIASYNYIKDNYPKYDDYPSTIYNLACAYFAHEDFREAIETFDIILNGDFNERESVAGRIMSNPYANYRHNSSMLMSTIYTRLEIYDSALVYLSYSDTLYTLQHDCVRAYVEEDVGIAMRYAEIYHKIGNNNEAIRVLLPLVWGEYFDNTDLLAELKKLLMSEKGVQKKLDRALKKIESATYKTYTYYSFYLYGTKIRVPDEYVRPKPFNLEKTTDKIKESKFYKMIEEFSK